jgi:hypothetical protein
MRSIIKLTGCVLGIIFLSAFQASAATPIVYYSFNTNGPDGNVTNNINTADIGSSISTFTTFLTGSGVLSYPAGSTLNLQPGGDPYVAGNSVSWNNWAAGSTTNRYVQVAVDMTGYQGLVLSYDIQRSAGGPKTNSVWYSADGGATFTSFNETFLSLASAYATFTNDMSAVTALDNNASVQLRFYPYLSNSGGTWRIDNLTIDATVIPEPSTILLVGVGLAGMIAIRRRRA